MIIDMTSIESKDPSPDRQQEQTRSALGRLAGDPLLWLALALTVAVCLAVFNHVHYINGPTAPKQWQWPYRHRDIFLQSCLGALWRLALGGALIGGIAWLIRRRMLPGVTRHWIGLAALFCWGVLFVWTNLITATPMRLSHLPRVIKSQIWTSYFNVAQWIQSGRLPPLGDTLERYSELLPQFPLHASTHPPGAVLSSYGLLRFFQSHPALSMAMGNFYQKIGADPDLAGVEKFTSDDVTALSLGILVTLAGQLGVFPLFWLVKRALKETDDTGQECSAERTAWVAALLWVHYPALVLMTPAFDLMHPALTLLCIYFTMRGLQDRPIAWGVALALLFMAGITFTFTLLLLAPMLCVMALLELCRRADSLRPKALLQQASLANPGGKSLWTLVAVTVITCLLADLLLRHIFGIHLWRTFFAAIQLQNDVHLAKLNRTFQVWVFYNIWDFLLFAGMPLAIFAIAWFARVFREWWRKPATIVPSLAIFPLMVLVVDLSHQLSAETARVWLFLASGMVWAGAAELVRRYGKHWRWVLAAVLLAQTVFIYLCRTRMQLWGY